MKLEKNKYLVTIADFVAAYQVIGFMATAGIGSITLLLSANWMIRIVLLLVVFLPSLTLLLFCRTCFPWTKNSRPKYFQLIYRKSLKRGFRKAFEQIKSSILWSLGDETRQFRRSLLTDDRDSEGLFLSKQDCLKEKVTIVLEDDAAGLEGDCRIPALFVNEQLTYDELFALAKDLFDRVLDPNLNSVRKGVVVTNSRMLSDEKSYEFFAKIGKALQSAAELYEEQIRWIIRTDSCLRAHVFHESIGLRDGQREAGIQEAFDYNILAPAYISEGRLTRDGVQYFDRDGVKIPIHRTLHANFRSQKYKTSNLAIWLEQKSDNKIARRDVELVNVERLRKHSPIELAAQLIQLKKRSWIVFDSTSDLDVYKVAAVILNIESLEKSVLIRGSTSLTSVFLGAEFNDQRKFIPTPPLALGGPGLIVAGSLTPRTKKQVRTCEDMCELVWVQFEKEDLENPSDLNQLIARKAGKISASLKEKKSVIFTTKEWFEGEYDEYPNSETCKQVLEVFSNTLKNLIPKPNWILFKGSDTAFHCITQGLDIRISEFIGRPTPSTFECAVLQQDSDEGCRRIVLFAGNVGETDELSNFLNVVTQSTQEPSNHQKLQRSIRDWRQM